MMYALDTNIIIHLLQNTPNVCKRFDIANQLYFKHTIIFHSAAFRAMLQARNEK